MHFVDASLLWVVHCACCANIVAILLRFQTQVVVELL